MLEKDLRQQWNSAHSRVHVFSKCPRHRGDRWSRFDTPTVAAASTEDVGKETNSGEIALTPRLTT